MLNDEGLTKRLMNFKSSNGCWVARNYASNIILIKY